MAGVVEPVLTERQRDVLQAILEDYIATAEPVGSRTLTKRNPNIDVSPATVRNLMADLEELGLLSAPHASAGRVPTALAFRVYVERLAQRGRISPKERELIQAITPAGPDDKRDLASILQDAGRILSSVSKHAALVLLPRLDEVVFERIELIPVREGAVLAIFVAKSGLIQHQVLDVKFVVDRDDLLRMSNYLNSILGGKTLADVRREILRSMADERSAADEMMRRALSLGERALATEPRTPMLVEGERTFLDQPEFADINKMRQLLRAFEEKTMLLRLLEAASIAPIDSKAAESSETRIVLGIEGSVKELKDLAAVATTYASAEGPAGSVAVVGPTRMDYSRVIPLVELTAEALSQSFAPGTRLVERSDVQPVRRRHDEE
jgi:heat-inducible transcriptional repressor